MMTTRLVSHSIPEYGGQVGYWRWMRLCTAISEDDMVVTNPMVHAATNPSHGEAEHIASITSFMRVTKGKQIKSLTITYLSAENAQYVVEYIVDGKLVGGI